MPIKVVQSVCLVFILSAQAPPHVNGPAIKAEQETNSTIQDQQDAKSEAQRRPPAPAKPPSLTSSDHADADGKQGSEQGTEFWPPFMGYRLKVTDSILVLLTAVLALVTTGLHVSTRRLWLDAREQTRIQSDTREIALSALDRPYILIDSVFYRLESNLERMQSLHFDFRMQNFGKGPAIIRSIVAFGFYSTGNDPSSTTRNVFPAIPFPNPDKINQYLFDRGAVRVFPETQIGIVNRKPLKLGYKHRQSVLVVRQDEVSPEFTHYASDATVHPSNKWINLKDGDYSKPVPWLIGKVTYTSVFGRQHQTRFCFRGRSDGICEEEKDAPYNERT